MRDIAEYIKGLEEIAAAAKTLLAIPVTKRNTPNAYIAWVNLYRVVTRYENSNRQYK